MPTAATFVVAMNRVDVVDLVVDLVDLVDVDLDVDLVDVVSQLWLYFYVVPPSCILSFWPTLYFNFCPRLLWQYLCPAVFGASQ